MKKVVIIVISLILVLGIGVAIGRWIKDQDDDSNDKAVKDEKNRYLTIVNETGEVINEVHITVGDGTEIEDAFRERVVNESERSSEQ